MIDVLAILFVTLLIGGCLMSIALLFVLGWLQGRTIGFPKPSDREERVFHGLLGLSLPVALILIGWDFVSPSLPPAWMAIVAVAPLLGLYAVGIITTIQTIRLELGHINPEANS